MERTRMKLAGAVAALAIAGGPARAAGSDTSKDVRVVNAAAEPVPVAVQGTAVCAVQGTPSVSAGQQGDWNVTAAQQGDWNGTAAQAGTWAVGISGTPAIRAALPTTLVRGWIEPNAPFVNSTGKRIVIELLSGYTGSQETLSVRTQLLPEQHDYLIPFEKDPNGVTGKFHVLTRIYMEPGEEFLISSGYFAHVGFSGHFDE